MLNIRVYRGSKAMEAYLNTKSNKGYMLKTISTFGLFEPLRLDAYRFQKNSTKTRVYRVDSRKIKEDDLCDYKQIFVDDGWTYFANNYANDNFNIDHIFYSDDSSKHEIFSDVESERKRNRDNATASLYKGCMLFISFIFFSIFFPSINSGSSHTFIGFILHNLYVIVAILIMVVSIIRYFRNK